MILDGESPAVLHTNVDGSAGCGKSYVLNVLCGRLSQMTRERGLPNPVLRAAPTGVVASEIQGRTLHSLLRLPVQKGTSFDALTGAALSQLQLTFRNIRYLVIDEKSMVGLATMGMISNRLIQACPDARAGERFGGISIILLGDFNQLPPVFDKPLYYARSLENSRTALL
jgi:ATP-dependent DNA helicase PIF1